MSDWVAGKHRIARFGAAIIVPPMISIVVFLLLNWVFWPSHKAQITQTIQESNKLEQPLKAMQQQVSAYIELKDAWNNEQALYQQLSAQFYDEANSVRLFGLLSEIAQDLDIEIEQIEWQNKNIFEGYSELPFSLRLRGRYQSLAQFFDTFSQAPIINLSHADWQRVQDESNYLYVDVQVSCFLVEPLISVVE